MQGDLHNGVLFNWRYQTREFNEHQPVPSRLRVVPIFPQGQ